MSVLKEVSAPDGKKENKAKLWLKRLGLAGFLFFFIKGLIWIAVFLGLGKVIKDLF